MEKFTHGIIAIDPTDLIKDPNDINDEGGFDMLHFVGYWSEPTEDDVIGLHEELCTDEEFGLRDRMDVIELLPAPQDIVDYYNQMIESGQIEDNE